MRAGMRFKRIKRKIANQFGASVGLLVVALIVLGTVTSNWLAKEIEGERRLEWSDRAERDAERLTEFVTLTVDQAAQAVAAIARQLGKDPSADPNMVHVILQDATQHLDAELFYTIAAIGIQEEDAVINQDGVVEVRNRLSWSAVATDMLRDGALQHAVFNATRLPGEVMVSRGFVLTGGNSGVALVAVPKGVAGERRAVVAVLDLESLFQTLMTTIAPDGLVLRVEERGAVGDESTILFGPNIRPSLALSTVILPVSYGESTWRYRWEVLPSYGGGLDLVLARTVRYGGIFASVLIALLVGGALFWRRGVAHAVRRRTKDLALARQRAEIANRAKSELLANMSHELRTPLNSVIGFAEVMEAHITDPSSWEQCREYATDIRASGQHLLSLINDILDLSKAEAGHLEIESAFVDPADLTAGVERLVHERARNKGVELDRHVDTADHLLNCDERRVKQILLNLLSNALKFTPKGGAITVFAEFEPQTGCMALGVRDTGIGMRTQDIPVAMTEFVQVKSRDRFTGEEGAGTGLGLPLSRNLARLHQATLTVQSSPGAGTTVTVVFPAERCKPAADVLAR